MAKKHKRQSRWTTQAGLQALVRFGPEESGIRAAEKVATDTFRSTVRQADAGARGIAYAVDETRPQVAADYDAAGLQAARAAHVSDGVIAGAPASMQAAISAERTGFDRRLGESRAQSLTELGSRKVQAAEGAAFAKQNAQRVLATDLSKLFARAQDLSREKGAFITGTAQQLQQAAQQRADTLASQEAGRTTTERGQDLSHQDRVAERKRQTAKDRQAAGGKGVRQTADKHDQVATSIEEIAGQASRLQAAAQKAGHPLTRAQLVKLLEQGRPARTDESIGPNGQKIKKPVPGRKPYAADLRMSAALDVALAGHLGRKTQQRLHKRGYSVRQLGLPTYGEWKKKQTPASNAGGLAGTLGQILGLG